MGCHPSHWLSYFSEGLKPPTCISILYRSWYIIYYNPSIYTIYNPYIYYNPYNDAGFLLVISNWLEGWGIRFRQAHIPIFSTFAGDGAKPGAGDGCPPKKRRSTDIPYDIADGIWDIYIYMEYIYIYGIYIYTWNIYIWNIYGKYMDIYGYMGLDRGSNKNTSSKYSKFFGVG